LAKLLPVAPLLAAAALWVSIQTSLKDTNCVIKAKECPTHSSTPKKYPKKTLNMQLLISMKENL
jgi:hypothetical protein